MYGVHDDLLRYAGSAFSKVVHFVNARQEDSASSELRMNEVAWPTFKSLFKSGKEDALYTYHFVAAHLTTGFYRLVDVLRKISDVMKEWLFRAPQEAAAAVSALRSIRPSDPISPQISAAVTRAAPVLVALDGLYIASALGGGNTSLYGAILAAQAFQTQIPIVIKTFVGRAAQPALPSFPSSTHPKPDQFVMQMGLIGAAWVLKTGVSVISSSQTPVHAIKTLAILAGTSPQIQHKVMETKVWKKIQSLSHSTSDQLLEFAKIPVKYGIRKSAEPMRRLLKTTWIQEQIRSGHYACVQEIHELFNGCAAPLPQKEQENLWDFMSWVGQKKVMTSGKQAAQAAADILVDNMAEAIILRTCNYAKFMLSAQGFILGMQKLSERNRLLGAAMIVASGGKGQTVQTCAIRVLTAGAFYYTSSALATPLMYGFLPGDMSFSCAQNTTKTVDKRSSTQAKARAIPIKRLSKNWSAAVLIKINSKNRQNATVARCSTKPK